MKNILSKFKDGIIIGAGILFVFGISNAWVDLGTVNPGDSLTDTVWNNLVTQVNETGNRVSGIFTDGSGNVGIGTTTPTAELEVNGTIVTDAYTYTDTVSIMPNDMSYSAGGYSDGSIVPLDRGVYLVKYYMCTGQNTFGASFVHVVSTSGTIDPVGESYIDVNVNSGSCGFFDTTILRVTSATASVNMRFGPYSTYSNVDNNPTANSVYARFLKIY